MNLQTLDNGLQVLIPCWEVPSHIRAFISTRNMGFSDTPFNTLNLGLHVGDRIENVLRNRSLIRQELPDEPIWLNQVHGSTVWTSPTSLSDADGAVSNEKNQVLSIMTADCMPILFCDELGDVIAACHAGWRGLALGIIQETVKAMVVKKGVIKSSEYISKLKVYLGPAIGPSHFEVGSDVFQAFASKFSIQQMNHCFVPGQTQGKYFANLFLIAKWILQDLGINAIYLEEICCYKNHNLFFSHRRDKQSGRFASFLWKEKD